MRRLLLLALALFGVYWWLRRLFGGARTRTQRPATSPTTAVEGGPMVRDRVCNTFIPRSRALTASTDDGTVFFCSEDCRSRFLEQSVHRPVA